MSDTAIQERTVSSTKACELVDCTYRGLDYWCRSGVLGDRFTNIGSGANKTRRFTAGDLEALHAVRQVMALAGGADLAASAARIVHGRRVDPAGEWLILQPHQVVRTDDARYPLDDITLGRIVRLESFTV